MIRHAKLLDMPWILKSARNLCYLKKTYTADLPSWILNKSLYVYESNGRLMGLLGFCIVNRVLVIDCVYAVGFSADVKQKVIKELIDFAIKSCKGLADKIEIEFDAVSNESTDLAILEEYKLKMTECKVVSSTSRLEMPDGCSTAKWGDLQYLRMLLSTMCKELQYTDEEKETIAYHYIENYKSTIVYKDIANGRVLGFAAICNADAGSSLGMGVADIDVLYVTPDARRRGIGKKLVNACLALAGKRHAHFLETTIDGSAIDYISMYRDFDIAVFSGIANYPSSTGDKTLTQIPSKVFK